MNKRRWVGLGLLVIPISIWIGWTAWFNSRTWCPVSKTISLEAGSRTEIKEFTVNLSGPYQIEIETEKHGSMTVEALSCSLGIGTMWPEQNCTAPPVLNMSWTLASNGLAIARGSSNETQGGGTTNETAIRTLGYFYLRSDQKYTLNVEMISDASSLAAANPKLVVDMENGAYEFKLVMGGILKLFAAVVIIIGLITLVMPLKSASLLRQN